MVGDTGSLSLYKASVDIHIDFAIEVANERLVQMMTRSDGTVEYVWRTLEPHDYLDTLSMCRAVLNQLGVTSSTFARNSTQKRNPKLLRLLAMRKMNSKVKVI